MGLVHVLQNLSAPSTLGPSISSAFIATLMGVGSANVIYLPVANRLKSMSTEEVELRTLTVEGILSVQAGDNPRVVADKLTSYVPPVARNSDEDRAALGDAAGPGRRRAPTGTVAFDASRGVWRASEARARCHHRLRRRCRPPAS